MALDPASKDPPSSIIFARYDAGPPYSLWVSVYLDVAVISQSCEAQFHPETLVLWGVATKKLSTDYLKWLRKNHKGGPQKAKEFRAVLEEFAPEMVQKKSA